MKRIRIVYTIPNFDTAGSGIALLKLVSNLNKALYHPIIVCQHDRGYLFQQVKDSGIEYHITNYLTPQKPRFQFIYGILKTTFFFRSLKADIIFSYHYAPDLSEVFAAKLAGLKFIYVKKNMGWDGPSYKQWRLKSFFSSAIVIQNQSMQKLIERYNKNLHYISIGVDLDEFHPRNKDLELQRQLNVSKGEKVILCVANLIQKKGIKYLIEGFAISDAHKTSKLFIIGNQNTDLLTETIELINKLNVSHRVFFQGKISDISKYYSIADLFVLPSIGDEGSPIVIQEAMASGVPVITTLIPGNMDQLTELPDQLIPPSDSNIIAKKIDLYLNMTDLQKKDIIDTQLQIVRTRYSLKAEVTLHESLYDSIL